MKNRSKEHSIDMAFIIQIRNVLKLKLAAILIVKLENPIR